MHRLLMRVLSTLTISLLVAIGGAESVAAETAVLSAEDRTELVLTIYGNGLALIRDRREALLGGEESRLAFAGVSPKMIASSARVSGAGLNVVALDYDFDLLTPQALLRRSLGHEVGVVRTHPTTGEETVERARVLSVEGGVVLRYRDRIESGVPGRLVFDAVPPDLHPLPTLVATVDGSEAGSKQRPIELSYLTEGLSWRADYALMLDESGERLTLDGRATVTNLSGTDFAAARLGLVAGNVRRVATPRPVPKRLAVMRAAAPMAAEAAAPMPERETFGDLHLYKVARPVTIADRQTKQLALMRAADVAVRRRYVSEGPAAVFRAMPRRRQPDHPAVVLQFINDVKTGPGQPLPAGTARIYARDSGGELRMIGEDRLSRTPLGGTVKLRPGKAFDITVERLQTDFVRAGLDKRTSESAHRITVRNAKATPVTVDVVEIIPGDWTILKESAPHTKEAADRARWAVTVAPGGSSELTYRVRARR